MKKVLKIIVIAVLTALFLSSLEPTPRPDIDISDDPTINFPNDFDDFDYLYGHSKYHY